MKRHLLASLALLLALPTWAQFAPRYLTLEHFTNTRCSICPSRNATLFNTLDANPGLIHHFAVHPSVPYNNCLFYQHNTAENDARRTLYSISGTPQAFVWGEKVWSGSTLLSQAKIDERKDQAGLIGLRVTESISNGNLAGSVSIRSYGAAPEGDWRLFVAVIERHISYNAPNGEDEHRNVFRDFQDAAGTLIDLPAVGATASFTFNFAMDSVWNSDEVYILAFVQNTDTREMLNSGTAADLQVDLLATQTTNGNDGSVAAQVNGGLPPYTITWDDPANTTGALVENLGPGTYTATITDANGISMADTAVIAGSVSIDDALQADFITYFNPLTQQLAVEIPQPAAGAGSLQLFNLQGQAVGAAMTIRQDQTQMTLTLQTQPKGLYFLLFEGQNGRQLSRKLQLR